MSGPADREGEGGAYTCAGEQARRETSPRRRQDPSEDPDCTRQETVGPEPGPPCPVAFIPGKFCHQNGGSTQCLECGQPTSQASPGEACSTPLPLLPKINEHKLCVSDSISCHHTALQARRPEQAPRG